MWTGRVEGFGGHLSSGKELGPSDYGYPLSFGPPQPSVFLLTPSPSVDDPSGLTPSVSVSCRARLRLTEIIVDRTDPLSRSYRIRRIRPVGPARGG